MAHRLTTADALFLHVETPATPMHVGTVQVFEVPESGFDHERLVRLIRERIAFVPRYRQRLRWVPAGLANPVWVDDEMFDVTYHVRRSALPRPGTRAQLNELVARIMSRPLDRSRPLWEVYLVEGLEGGGFAVLSKTHESMVDGTSVELGQVILDDSPHLRPGAADHWRPAPEPSTLELIAGAVGDNLRHPASVIDTCVSTARRLVDDVRDSGASVTQRVLATAAQVGHVARAQSESPLLTETRAPRRFATLDLTLEDLRKVRGRQGGTVNDVVLAVIAGGLRSWLLARGEPADYHQSIRAMVPVSVNPGRDRGNRVEAFVVDLPVGEPDPVVRLQQISFDMARHQQEGHLLSARSIAGVVGFAPPTLHALGARLGSTVSRRAASLVITNVPGPQIPLYAVGARMTAAYPVIPIAKGHALAIGLTSYDGGVFVGLNADRDAVPDLDELVESIEDSAAQLVDTSTRRRRGRVANVVPITGEAG